MAVTNETLYLSLPRSILKYFGVWHRPKSFLILHYIKLFVIMLSQYCFLTFQFVYVYTERNDFEKVSGALYFLFSEASMCFKATVFLLNKKHLKTMLDMMGSDIMVAQTCEHENCLTSLARKIRRFCILYVTILILSTIMMASAPLFDNTAEHRSFPFEIWMPVSTETSPEYELAYLYQVLNLLACASIYIALDVLAISMIMFGCAELDVVMLKIKKIKKVFNSANRVTNEEKQLRCENYDLLIECIRHHQAVIDFVNEVESTFHSMIFFQLSGTVAIICLTGVKITSTTESKESAQLIQMSTYLLTVLAQLFLYCWCGNELTTRSEKISDVLYECPWYEQDLKFRRALWIAMERMKRPVIFRAGYFITLSRMTFVSILRSSYTYFAVLNQVNN